MAVSDTVIGRVEGGGGIDTYLHVIHPLLLLGALLLFFWGFISAIDLSSFACILGMYIET